MLGIVIFYSRLLMDFFGCCFIGVILMVQMVLGSYRETALHPFPAQSVALAITFDLT